MRHVIARLCAGIVLLVGALAATASPASAATNHEVPFPCGQTWSGQTRTNHSPVRAIDFNRTNDAGDAVAASAAGTVVHRGSKAGTSYGNLVIIRHADGTATYYAHLSGFNVSLNQSVSQGQVIGYVGGTGFPNTPGGFGTHLHYEQRTAVGGSVVSIKFDGVTALYYGTKNYTSSNRCGGSSNPYTRQEVCGTGYSVIDSAAIGTKGRAYLLYNSGNGNNCVVTLKTSGFTATATSAFLEVQGQTRVTDSGNYTYYAGPVRKAAPGTCVKWGGAITGTTYTSAFEHCG
jgi:hypothetical protein